MPNLTQRNGLPPDVQGALKALDRRFEQLHTIYGPATQILCYDHIHDTRSDHSQAYSDAFVEWCSDYPALSSRFSELAERRTPSAIFRAYFGFYIEIVAIGARRIFADLMEIGNERQTDGIAWAKSQARYLKHGNVASWVRPACDKQADPRSWRAPLFLTMKLAGGESYDPYKAWERMNATSTMLLLGDFSAEYERRLKHYIEIDAGTAYLEAATRPKPAGKIIEASIQARPESEADAKARRKQALLTRLATDDPRPFTNEEAAIIFERDERTIRYWVEEGKLISADRGKVTAESVRQFKAERP